jgi:hypothetical protein
MIHGTFSTTRGSFAALELTDTGKAFLEHARERYDAVMGFDHPTLASTPEENAREILAALAGLPSGTIVDAVSYSRGGLVFRSLVEMLAPEGLQFRNAVFVGCTNAGTNLAEPENWEALVDLYTNVVMAGSRAIGIIAGGVGGEIVASTVSTIARFVKLVSQMAIDERRVPGLAAMEPDGEFVKALNAAAESAEPATRYHVVASNFQPRIEPSKGLTGELVEYLLNRVVDRLLKEDNDLVVHTASMSQFGNRSGRLAPDDVVVLPAEDVIYHTIYFASPKLGGLLLNWLGTDSAAEAGEQSLFQDKLVRELWRRGRPDFSTEPTKRVMAEQIGPRGRTRGGGEEEVRSWSTRSRDAPQAAEEPPAPAGGAVAMGPAATEASVPEPPELLCHFAAEMNPAPQLGVPTPLFVTIAPHEIAVAEGPTSAATAEPVRTDSLHPIEVEVIPGRNCRIVGADASSSVQTERKEHPGLKIVDVPTRGSVSLRFEIEGIEGGVADIFVEARQGPRLLASFLLKPIFTAGQEERLSVSQIARPTYNLADEPAVLRIHEMYQPNGALRLRFELSCEDPNIFIKQDVDLPPLFNLAGFNAGFLAKLENAYQLKQYDAVLKRIRDFSIVSTNGLLPKEVRQELWDNRSRIRSVQVISEDPLIPWELLYIANPAGGTAGEGRFLCEWGLVRWMYNARWPRRTIPLRSGRIFYVIPSYLDPRDVLEGAQEEEQMLRDRFGGPQAIEPTSDGVRQFLAGEEQSCDLLHFACHGETKQEAVLSSDLVMAGLRNHDNSITEDLLGHETVKIEAKFGLDAPAGMVFINACQTGRQGTGIAGVMGFADSFIRPMSGQGVSAFIGALWSVDDKLALTFADTFYTRFLRGDMLVEAAQAAREACKKKQDFTWLAYSIYGHPFARASRGE